jgi:hypothetical protein
LGGREYEVYLQSAFRQTGSTMTSRCADFVWNSRLIVVAHVRALEPDSLVASLSQGSLPECRQGNVESTAVSFGITNRASMDQPVDAEITYRGKQDTLMLFDLSDFGGFYLQGRVPFAEPAIGTRFWLRGAYDMFVLRTARDGEIALAAMSVTQDATRIAQWLGTPFRIEPDCAYARTATRTLSLQTAVFGENAGVRVRSGERAEIEVQGHMYEVTAHSDSELGLTITPLRP